MATTLPLEALRAAISRGRDPFAGLPPGPRVPRLAQTLGWLFFPVPFIEACRRRFGHVFTIRLGGFPPFVALGDPAAIKDVFTGDPEVFHAGRANVILKPILGESSLLMLDGPRHRDERKLMMPALHGERMHAYERVMRERADAIIDRWPMGEAFPLHPEMQEVTLAVILETVFGLGEGATRGALREALVDLLDLGEHPSLLMLIDRNGRPRGVDRSGQLGRFSPWRVFARRIERVDALLAGEVRARRAAGEGGADVLSMFLAARDEEGRSLSDQALVDEMKTLLIAGHETTANALTWTVLELSQNPAILARLRDEATRGDEYLDAVIRESMRLHPIVPMVGRLLQADATVGGRRYPEGTIVAPSIYLTHTNPDVYPDPMRFDPERFLGAKRPGPYEYLPFGGGVRRCIGMAFAFFEMRVVLRQIVTRARLRLAPGYRPRLVRRGITFAVAGGLPVVRDG